MNREVPYSLLEPLDSRHLLFLSIGTRTEHFEATFALCTQCFKCLCVRFSLTSCKMCMIEVKTQGKEKILEATLEAAAWPQQNFPMSFIMKKCGLQSGPYIGGCVPPLIKRRRKSGLCVCAGQCWLPAILVSRKLFKLFLGPWLEV